MASYDQADSIYDDPETIYNQLNLDGSTTVVFTPLGLIAGQGLVSGSIPITFTPSGTIGAEGFMNGLGNFTFTPIGDLSSGQEIQGLSEIVFLPIGLLFGEGQISGQGQITFSLSGKLTKSPYGPSFPVSGIVYETSSASSSSGIYELSNQVTGLPYEEGIEN